MAMHIHLLFFGGLFPVYQLNLRVPLNYNLNSCVGGRCSRHRMKDATAVNKRKADFDSKAVV